MANTPKDKTPPPYYGFGSPYRRVTNTSPGLTSKDHASGAHEGRASTFSLDCAECRENETPVERFVEHHESKPSTVERRQASGVWKRGDLVRHTATFCRSIGDVTPPINGTVVAIGPVFSSLPGTYLDVAWSNGHRALIRAENIESYRGQTVSETLVASLDSDREADAKLAETLSEEESDAHREITSEDYDRS